MCPRICDEDAIDGLRIMIPDIGPHFGGKQLSIKVVSRGPTDQTWTLYRFDMLDIGSDCVFNIFGIRCTH